MDSYEEVKAENERLRAILDAGARDALLALPGVRGVSVGVKERAGRFLPGLCFRVYVDAKLPESELHASAVVPKEISGIPTDVHEIPTLTPLMADETRYRPVKGGIRITTESSPTRSEANIAYGTLGCIGRNRRDNSIVGLTCWHVLFTGTAVRGDAVHQPALAVNGEARTATGENVIGIIGDGIVSEAADCGVVKIDASWCRSCGTDWRDEVNRLVLPGHEHDDYRGIRGVADAHADPGASEGRDDPEAFVAGHPERIVYMVGAETGAMVRGFVVDTGAMGHVVYDEVSDDRVARNPVDRTYRQEFSGQIVVHPLGTEFGQDGDSGSVVVNSRSEVIGLFYASYGGQGWLNPIGNVINALRSLTPPIDFEVNYTEPPPATTTTRAATIGVPVTHAEIATPNLWALARARLQRSLHGRALTAAVEEHRREAVDLVNGCRPVTVAWRRAQGPVFLTHLMKSIAEEAHEIPIEINGVTLYELGARMREVLARHGSAELRENLAALGDRLLATAERCRSFAEFAARLDREASLSGEPA